MSGERSRKDDIGDREGCPEEFPPGFKGLGFQGIAEWDDGRKSYLAEAEGRRRRETESGLGPKRGSREREVRGSRGREVLRKVRAALKKSESHPLEKELRLWQPRIGDCLEASIRGQWVSLEITSRKLRVFAEELLASQHPYPCRLRRGGHVIFEP